MYHLPPFTEEEIGVKYVFQVHKARITKFRVYSLNQCTELP